MSFCKEKLQMKREAAATAQCRISVTEQAKGPNTYEGDMLCVYPSSADLDVVTGNILNCYRYRALTLSCA